MINIAGGYINTVARKSFDSWIKKVLRDGLYGEKNKTKFWKPEKMFLSDSNVFEMYFDP